MASVSSADSSSSRWIAKPTCTMTYSPTCDVREVLPGRPPCGRRRSRPRPSACRRVPRGRATRPGTARHMGLSSLCEPCVGQRGEPTRTWPSARPPSLGGTRRWRSTVKPSARSAVRRSPSSSALREHAAGRGRPCRSPVLAARRAAARSTTSVDDRGVEPRRDQRGRRRPPRRSPTTAPRHRGRVGDRAAVVRARAPNAYAARRPAPARASALQLDRGLRPRSRRACRTPASEETASKSRPMLEVGTQPSPVSSWWASTAALVRRAGRAPAAGRRSQATPAARRWASAIRYGPAHARRRRRAAARSARCANRRNRCSRRRSTSPPHTAPSVP